MADAAKQFVEDGTDPTEVEVRLKLTYYHEGDSPDVDNIIKPIQDALIGVVYVDDSQVAAAASERRKINGFYQIRGASSTLLNAFADGRTFVHLEVTAYIETGKLN